MTDQPMTRNVIALPPDGGPPLEGLQEVSHARGCMTGRIEWTREQAQAAMVGDPVRLDAGQMAVVDQIAAELQAERNRMIEGSVAALNADRRFNLVMGLLPTIDPGKPRQDEVHRIGRLADELMANQIAHENEKGVRAEHQVQSPIPGPGFDHTA